MTGVLAHGGALEAAVARFGGARADWLDLSTGINPRPPALPSIPLESWTRLPEVEDVAALAASFRRFAAVAPEAEIVACAGSGAPMVALATLLPPGPAATLRLTYGGHAQALTTAGHAVTLLDDPADLPELSRLAFVAHPNNPDGRRFAAADLLSLADRLAARGGFLVVDEAFMDADPRETVTPFAGRPGLVVLRSFGKVFGLAGLRLGFAIVPPALAGPLRLRLGEWPVSGPAIAVGRALLDDPACILALRAEIREASGWTQAAIRRAGLHPTGDVALFMHLRHPRAKDLFEALARRRILVRAFAQAPDALRIGLCASEGEAERLGASLGQALREIA